MTRQIININDKIKLITGGAGCNIYYLDFAKKAVIDTGHPIDAVSNHDYFKMNGIDIADSDYIINTHSHGDHTGGNAYFKKINPDIKIITYSKYEQYKKIQEQIQVLKGAEIDYEKYEPDILVNDQDEIDLGDVKLKVIHTPGHTADSISLYLSDPFNILFSGDVIYSKVISQFDYYQDLKKSCGEMSSSYEKIKNLNVKTIYPGHGGSIINVNENVAILEKKIKKLENNYESMIINTFIPSVEFFIFNNKGTGSDQVKDFFISNMKKFKKASFCINLEEERFLIIIDKMISLMKFLKIIEEKDNKLYTVNHINYYIF